MVSADDTTAAPMAAALLRQHLDRAGIRAEITSAGIGESPVGVSSDAATAMLHWGIDLSQHVPRIATPALVANDGRDLIVTTARDQLRRLVASDRRTWVRTFTLKELVRAVDGAVPTPGVRFEAWAAEIVRRRRGVDLVDDDPVDDLADVGTRGIAAVRSLADEIHDLTVPLVSGIPWS